MRASAAALPRLRTRRRFRRPGNEELFHLLWMVNGLVVIAEFVVRPDPLMAFTAFLGLLVYGTSYIQRRWILEYEEDGKEPPWPPPSRWDWFLATAWFGLQVLVLVGLLV